MAAGMRSLRAATGGACLLLLATASPAMADARPAPDLVPRPPASMHLGSPDEGGENATPVLRFSATVANLGEVAFEFAGAPQGPSDPEGGIAYQCVAFVSRACTEREARGRLIWHPQHQHFHVDAFASYAIVPVSADGEPDLSAQPLVAAPKVSFCLMDSSREHEPRALSPNPALYHTCTFAVQGISAGWGDLYEYDLPGQSLPIDGLADGRYALVIEVDPLERFLQAETGNDIAWRIFDLVDRGTRVIVGGES